MDLDALREALELYDRGAVFRADLVPVIAAARAVLDSEEAWWCETHVTNGCTHYGADHCKETHYSQLSHAYDTDCSMVRRRLLAEEGT